MQRPFPSLSYWMQHGTALCVPICCSCAEHEPFHVLEITKPCKSLGLGATSEQVNMLLQQRGLGNDIYTVMLLLVFLGLFIIDCPFQKR